MNGYARTWANLALCAAFAVALPASIRAREDTAALDAETVPLRYERARSLAQSGATEAALAEFESLLALYPNDADYLLGRAQMQARLGETGAAIETAERALALAPDYEDVWRLRMQLAERAGDSAATAAVRAAAAARFPAASWWQPPPAPVEYRRWVSGGYGSERLSNGAPTWSREFMRVDWRSSAGESWFAELARSERFGQSDRWLSIGGSSSVLPRWRLGGALGGAGDARFLPDKEISVEATRAWGRGWAATFAAREREYASGDVASVSLTGEKYVADFRVAYRLDRARLTGAGSASTHALMLTWYPSERRSFGVTLGAGEEIETIDLDRLLRTSVSNVTFTGNEAFSPRLSLGWWLGTHDQGDFYRRDYAGLSVRIGF
jgi:YaiO family outer membrane protein